MLARTVHQPLDLALGEVASLDCQVYDVWSAVLGSRFHADKPCLPVSHCISYTPFLDSQKGESGALSASGSQCRWKRSGRVLHAAAARAARLACAEGPR